MSVPTTFKSTFYISVIYAHPSINSTFPRPENSNSNQKNADNLRIHKHDLTDCATIGIYQV